MPSGFIGFLVVVVLLFVAVGAVPGLATSAGPLFLFLVIGVAALVLIPGLRRLVIGLVVVALLAALALSAVNTQVQQAKNTISSATSVPGAMLEAIGDTLFGPGVSLEDNRGLAWLDSLTKGYRRFEGTPFVRGDGDRCCIDPNDITQGFLGDCWMLASLGALALTSPGTIANAIRDNGDGTYDVTLYRKQGSQDRPSFVPEVIRVDNLFPALRWPFYMMPGNDTAPLYARTGDSGLDGTAELWVMVIEKAFAQRDAGYPTVHGGLGYDALEVMTGRPSTGVNPRTVSRARLASLLNSLHGSGYAITAGTLTDDELSSAPAETRGLFAGPGQTLVTEHEYFVRDYDAAAETLVMGNPHGAFAERPTFSLTLDQFQRGFGQVAFNRPATAAGINGCQCP